MTWDANPGRMESLRESIRPIVTDIALRQVLSEDFPRDCADLPISGGWGYTQPEAIIFIRDQFPRPSAPDFVGLEYHIARKIIYEELIVFRPEGSRYSGIDMKLRDQRTVNDRKTIFDCLNFVISCWSEFHWEYLKKEWEENDAGQRPGFDWASHIAKRNIAKIEYERQLWFNITDVYDRD